MNILLDFCLEPSRKETNIPLVSYHLSRHKIRRGPKKFLATLFFESFFSAASCIKDSKNDADGKFFGPSYFDPVLKKRS